MAYTPATYCANGDGHRTYGTELCYPCRMRAARETARPARPAAPARAAQPEREYYTPETCRRCNGNGWIRGFEHVEMGRCFNCRGDGRVMWIPESRFPVRVFTPTTPVEAKAEAEAIAVVEVAEGVAKRVRKPRAKKAV